MSELLEFLRTHEQAFRSRARLASLYSDFRYQRQSNPDGYQANITAWQRALASAAKAGLLPSSATGTQHDRFAIHTGDALARALQTQELGRPLALSAVVEEAVNKREMVPVRLFFEAKGSLYVRSWVPSVGDVVKWGLRQIGVGTSGQGDGRLSEGEFVVLENVETAAQAVLDAASKVATSNTSRIFSTDLFASTFGPAADLDTLSSTDLSILLTHLSRDRSAISFDQTSGTVKFKAPTEQYPSPITQEDISIASLRTLISSLEPQIQQLTKKVNELDRTAREAVTRKNVTGAKTALRSKKLADATLQQRTATLSQVEEVYAKIEQAADQVEIVRVMEAAGHTLKSLNKQTGGVEKVQDVMDGLREQIMDVDDIGQAINESSAGAIDEGEVDDELEAMKRAEREKREETERKTKEERDEREAEQTWQKLAELDQVGEKAKAEKVSTPGHESTEMFGDNVRESEHAS